MDDYRLRRAQSLLLLSESPVSLIPQRSASLTRVRRVQSVPHIPTSANMVSRQMWLTENYRPRPYRRDWDAFDDYWHDRYYSTSPLYWSTYRWAGRRYYLTDSPYSSYWYYPRVWGTYPRYKWNALDYLDPLYGRQYAYSSYDRPLWYPSRSSAYDNTDVVRGVEMYKYGLINFNTLDKFWLEPSASERRYSSWRHDRYIPTSYYGTRRYFYSFL